MPEISTFLTFNGQAEEAARFYTSIFPNSKITRIAHYPDLGPEAPFEAGRDDRGVHARRPPVHRTERRAAVRVQPGHFHRRALRHAAAGG